jgi:hypothetical protein
MPAKFSRDLPGARRLRRYAPILVVLGLAVAAVAPGMMAESGDGGSNGALERIGLDAPSAAATAVIQ